MKTMQSAEDCMRKDILAYVSYPPRVQGACFPYLQYEVMNNGEIAEIPAEIFPQTGAIVVPFRDQLNATEVRETFGNIVVLRINRDSPDENTFMEDQAGSQNRYRAYLYRSGGFGEPELTFTKLSMHALSSRLVQIVTLKSTPSFSSPLLEPVELGDGQIEPNTQLVMVEVRSPNSGHILVGPFAYKCAPDGTLSLSGDEGHDYRVAEIQEEQENVISLRDQDRIAVARFVDSLDPTFRMSPAMETYDWLPREKLSQLISDIMSGTPEFSDLSKSAKRRMRTEIRVSSERADKIHLDEARRNRLEQVFDDVEFFSELPETLKETVANSIPQEKLSSIVLDNPDYFSKMIRDLPEVSEGVERERARLSQSLSALKAEEIAAGKARDEAVAAQKAAEADLKATRDEALVDIQHQVEDLRTQRDGLRSECEDLRGQQGKLERGIKAALDEMSDETALSQAIVKQGIVRHAVDLVTSLESSGTADEPLFANNTKMREDEDELSDEKVAEIIYQEISEISGRDYTRDDVINLLICLTQGYITTFAGLPGTGKTSTCEILAMALGLSQGVSNRFVEVSVERGWASHKDMVGYYNPLTRTVEKSNPEVYDSLEMLSREADSPSRHAPFVFLLDEANLSPIEHYWAPFLRACDTFGRGDTSLSLGGDKPIRIPSWVRFLATVNSDHTTEELSPRFLDRAWVITLSAASLGSDALAQDLLSEKQDIQSFSQERLEKAFGRHSDLVADDATNKTLSEVLDVCERNGKSVSARSQSMIAGYLSAATHLMDTSSAGGRYSPLDRAVAQKILPLLSGSEDQMHTLLRELEGSCAQLPISKGIVSRMLQKGEGNGYYQFFE